MRSEKWHKIFVLFCNFNRTISSLWGLNLRAYSNVKLQFKGLNFEPYLKISFRETNLKPKAELSILVILLLVKSVLG